MSANRSWALNTALLLQGFVFLFLSFSSVAGEIISPRHIEDVALVGAENVIELMGKIDNLIIVDSRIPGDRQKGYIESSVSLPDTKTNCKTLAEILPDKNTPALFYCNGVECGRSAIAIEIAKECGYKELYWFRGGFKVWMEKGFPYIQN